MDMIMRIAIDNILVLRTPTRRKGGVMRNSRIWNTYVIDIKRKAIGDIHVIPLNI